MRTVVVELIKYRQDLLARLGRDIRGPVVFSRSLIRWARSPAFFVSLLLNGLINVLAENSHLAKSLGLSFIAIDEC